MESGGGSPGRGATPGDADETIRHHREDIGKMDLERGGWLGCPGDWDMNGGGSAMHDHGVHHDEPPGGAGAGMSGLWAAPACARMWEACADCRAGKECTGGSDGEEAEKREEVGLEVARRSHVWRSMCRRVLWMSGQRVAVTPRQLASHSTSDRFPPDTKIPPLNFPSPCPLPCPSSSHLSPGILLEHWCKPTSPQCAPTSR